MTRPTPLHALGIDTGGTSIKAAIVREDGTILTHRSVPTPADQERYLDTVVALVEELTQQANEAGLEVIDTIGLDTPGLVNDAAGIVEYSSSLGWRNFPVRDLVSQRLGRPVAYGHDVRTGALAESYWGADHANFFYIAIGTGIATVLILNHEPVATGGWVGEMGQLITNPGCDTPLRVEDVAAAGGIAKRAHSSGLISAQQGAADVYALADAGNATALRIVEEATAALAGILAPVIAALGPIPIVIGGGLANRGQTLFAELARALTPILGEIPLPPIEAAQLGSWSQVQGAACRAFHQTPPAAAPAGAQPSATSGRPTRHQPQQG